MPSISSCWGSSRRFPAQQPNRLLKNAPGGAPGPQGMPNSEVILQAASLHAAFGRYFNSLLTNKDSIERSAPTMIEWKQDTIARSLNAIWGWTSPGLPCLFLFMPLTGNGLQKPARGPNPRTEPSVPQTDRTVQSAFWGRNSHLARESSSCRAAAQSNFCSSECAGRVSVAIRSPRRRIAERLRSA